MEVEGVVAAFAADAADSAAAEWCGEVANQERVDPHQPCSQRSSDSLGTILRAELIVDGGYTTIDMSSLGVARTEHVSRTGETVVI